MLAGTSTMLTIAKSLYNLKLMLSDIRNNPLYTNATMNLKLNIM